MPAPAAPAPAAAKQASPAATALSDDEKARRAVMMRKKAAALGDLALLMMNDPHFKNSAMADLEWLVLPALFTNQYALINDKLDDGVVVPLAAITWAMVSSEVDQQLQENLHRPFRLAPSEWASGDILWLAHTFGPPQVVNALIDKVRAEHQMFKGRALKVRVHAENGQPMVKVVE